jgi:hypothetical protein
MLHVRLIAPPGSTPQVLQLLDASPAVTHLCVNEQSARKPSGDVVSFDVAREGATSILEAVEISTWTAMAQLWWKTWTSAFPSPRSGPKKKPWRAGRRGGLGAA